MADDVVRSEGPNVLVVYTGLSCCLCDEARIELDRIAPQLGLDVQWRYVDGDAALEAAWRTQLPAGVLDGRKVFKYRVDEHLLRRAVDAKRR